MEELQKINEDEMGNTWCVYMHINKVNDKKYIGITGRPPHQRWGHNGNNYKREPIFYAAINKYGWDGFEHFVIADDLTEQDAKQLEIELIALYKTNCFRYKDPKCGYNCTDGGDGRSGSTVSEDTRQKLREYRLGTKLSQETRMKISESNKGRIVSEETREKLRIANSGENNYWHGKQIPEKVKQKLREALSGDKNPMYGKKRPPEIIEKMANGVKEKWKDEEFRDRMSNLRSELTSGKNNPKARQVVQLSLYDIFIRNWDYIGEAANFYNVSESCIRACCNGKQKTSCGFKWMYKEDYEEWVKSNVL